MLVDFYHLTASPIERVLPRIGEKLLSEKERLLVVAEPNLLDQLDSQLWSYARDSFLLHGRHDGPAPGEQPILLSPRSEEHTSELQSLMRISYDVFCLKKKNTSFSIHH